MKQEVSSTTKTSSDGKVSSQKNSPKVSLQDLQRDGNRDEHTTKTSVEFYNKFIRKEGQLILTEKELEEKIKAAINANS